MGGYIDLKRLNLDELVGVVNLYPWFAGARKELCMRMKGELLGNTHLSDSAMYLPSRKVLSDILRADSTFLEDADVEEIIKSYIAEERETVTENPKRRVYAGAGDYFSQEDYDKVRQTEDNVFSKYAFKSKEESRETSAEEPVFDIFTETLAQIYAEQGYYEQAKDIYSKLILAYPEKNAYFAGLIQKLDESN